MKHTGWFGKFMKDIVKEFRWFIKRNYKYWFKLLFSIIAIMTLPTIVATSVITPGPIATAQLMMLGTGTGVVASAAFKWLSPPSFRPVCVAYATTEDC